MIVYVDTSNLLKLYLDEIDSESVRASLDANDLVSSIIAYTEARAGLARALRLNRVVRAEYGMLLAEFERGWLNVRGVDVDDSLVREAGELAELHNLRGYDAIHLASAVRLQRLIGESVRFSAADERLMSAAAEAGLAV